nr:integral membrane protein [Mycolicibacterium malmesburyense]
MLIAVTATTIGFAFDAGSGSKELGTVFAVCYVLGCLAAVLAVRQQAVFTAVIQPPLLLFVTVPGAYFLFTGGQFTGVKDLAINCGYPLIERFPLMFFTSAAVLLIGIGRWYIGMSTRRASPSANEDAEAPRSALASTVATAAAATVAKIKSLLAFQHRDEDDEVAAPPRRRRPQNAPRAARADRTASRTRSASNRSGRPAKRSAPSRSRHVRPPDTELIEPVERPRRPRAGRHAEPAPGPEPRRRPRTPNPRQPGPPPSERRAGYERRGFDRSADRVERRRRFDSYEPREPHGRNGVGHGNGSGNGDYHPVSRVRYRGEEADDRAEYRTRRRAPRGWEADSWEYDI